MIFLLLLVAAPFLDSLPIGAEIPEDRRLPDHIRPTHYHLKMLCIPGPIHKENFTSTMNGNIAIKVTSTGQTDRVILHSDGLHIKKVSTGYKDLLTVRNWKLESEFLIIYLDKNTSIGDVFWLIIDFHGNLTGNLNDYYMGRSDNSEGISTVHSITQLVLIDTRKITPCFDEPQFKATWDLELKYPREDNALSNLVRNKTTKDRYNDKCRHSFYEETVPMSPDQLAIFIGDVDYEEAMTDKRTRIVSDEKAIENILSGPAIIKLPSTKNRLDSSKQCGQTCKVDIERALLYNCTSRCETTPEPSSGRPSKSAPLLLLFSLLIHTFFL